MAGLASGMDWKSVVSQLADISRAPEKTLQKEQSQLQQRNAAYKAIATELSTLSDKISALKDTSLYGKRSTESSDSTVATASADTGAATGTYSFTFSQLAKSASIQGATNVAGPLSSSGDLSAVTVATAGLSTSITAGTFSVNGKKVTVAATDTLEDVLNNISTATDGAVTASYDSASDKITLESSDAIMLGNTTDTSNILQALKLTGNGATSISSSSALGGLNRSSALQSANFATAITDDGSGSGKGQFSINGVTIDYSVGDRISDVLTRINQSAAGVSASFDASKGQFVLANKNTGDMGISLEDVGGNFLAATGLLGGTLLRGQNLVYSVNGGGDLVSSSNTITESTSGIAGLSVTALKSGSSATITVSTDTSGVNTAVNDFVTEYNKVQSLIDTYTASTTDSTGKVTAGVLANESDALEIASSLRSLAYKPSISHSSAVSSLDDLGIVTSGNDDKLTISDSQKLTDGLANHLNDIQNLFTNSTSGLAVKLSSFLDRVVGDDGSLVQKQSSLTKQSSNIDKQIADIERQVQAESDNMTQEFIAMETAQQNLSSQLKYLQQNLGTSSNSSK